MYGYITWVLEYHLNVVKKLPYVKTVHYKVKYKVKVKFER